MVTEIAGSRALGNGRRDHQRDATRRRIRAIALEVIGRDGLVDARIGDIAESAGVSRGTVYFHYASKEDVAAEVLEEAEARIAEAVRRLPADASVARALRVFCAAFAREWESRPEIFRAVAAVSLRRGAERMKTQHRSDALQVLRERFRAASERGELKVAAGSSFLAHIFLVNILSATLAWTERPKTRLADPLGSALDIFLSGAVSKGQRLRRRRSDRSDRV